MPQAFCSVAFRLPESEMGILQRYCERSGRNRTDVLRELVRGLEPVEPGIAGCMADPTQT